MLHHSPHHAGRVLGINKGSRQALDAVITRCEISVLLTGHVHVPGGNVATTTNGAATWDVFEARCGTTTQRDLLPVGWQMGSPPLAPNTLLVHRLFRRDDGRVEWAAEVCERSARGFRSKGALRLQGRLPGQGVVVWPRT